MLRSGVRSPYAPPSMTRPSTKVGGRFRVPCRDRTPRGDDSLGLSSEEGGARRAETRPRVDCCLQLGLVADIRVALLKFPLGPVLVYEVEVSRIAQNFGRLFLCWHICFFCGIEESKVIGTRLTDLECAVCIRAVHERYVRLCFDVLESFIDVSTLSATWRTPLTSFALKNSGSLRPAG